MNDIPLQSTWRYVGPLPGRGELHLVVFAEPHEIVTVATGHGWLGDQNLFFKHFQRIK